jgi:hypothetical protein
MQDDDGSLIEREFAESTLDLIARGESGSDVLDNRLIKRINPRPRQLATPRTSRVAVTSTYYTTLEPRIPGVRIP